MMINVGDYVRNKYGIAKVLEMSEDVVKQIQIIKFDRPICFLVNPETGEERNRTNILPITPNIDLDKIKIGKLIDLIEVGDLLFVDIDNDYKGGIIVPRIPETQNELNLMIGLIKNGSWILKGIVIREQIEDMEYKIERL